MRAGSRDFAVNFHAPLIILLPLSSSLPPPLTLIPPFPSYTCSLDLHLGRFVSFGALMGLAEEASIMAAAMSLPKSPFRIANSLIHTDVDEYNKIVREGFYARCRLDRGYMSEPMLLLHALWEWRHCGDDTEKFVWCQRNNIAHARMRQLNSIATNLWTKTQSALSLGGGNRNGVSGNGSGTGNGNLLSSKATPRKISSSSSSSSSNGLISNGTATGGGATGAGGTHNDASDLRWSLALAPHAANALRLACVWAFHRYRSIVGVFQ